MVGIACKTGDQLEHELNGLKEVPGPDFKLEKSFRRVPLAVEALGRGFVAGVLRLGIIGKAPSSVIC
jgi:hypothetical protein